MADCVLCKLWFVDLSKLCFIRQNRMVFDERLLSFAQVECVVRQFRCSRISLTKKQFFFCVRVFCARQSYLIFICLLAAKDDISKYLHFSTMFALWPHFCVGIFLLLTTTSKLCAGQNSLEARTKFYFYDKK